MDEPVSSQRIRFNHRSALNSANLPLLYLCFVIIVAFGLRVAGLNTLPRSLSLDEAVDGLDALQLIRLPWLTPFLQNNFGRETLFFYLQGLALQLYGISIFSLRISSAIAATLTIPLLYIVGQRLVPDNSCPDDSGQQSAASRKPAEWGGGRLISLLAATGLAVSYWHIYFSRVALRAILLPLLLLALIWCFWWGWYLPPLKGRGVRRGWLILAGFLLGLTFYTYLAARLLPIFFSLFFFAELLRSNSNRLTKTMDFLLFVGTAAVIAMPLLLYFQQNPQALSSRTQAISIFAGSTPVETLWDNSRALLQIHFLGNTWLGQWPALDLLSAVGFLLGLLLCLYHFRKPVCLFLLLWWIIGTAPVLLSKQDWDATTTLLRGIIAWPALFLISSIGLATATRYFVKWARQSLHIHNSQFAIHNSQLITLPLLLLLCGGLTSAYNYFFVWATTYNDFSDHPAAIARYLNHQTEQLTLTPLKFYGETVTNFLLQAQYPHLANIDSNILRSLLRGDRPTVYLWPDKSTAESVFVLLVPAANGQGTAYLWPPLKLPQMEAMAKHTHATAPLSTVLDSEWEPVSQIYPLTQNAPFLSSSPLIGERPERVNRPIQASFNNQILLIDYYVEPTPAKPGDTVTLRLDWQAQRPLDGDYYLFIHLVDVAQKRRYSQVNIPLTGVLFNAHRWPVGLAVPDLHYFTLPTDIPEGIYFFEVGLYDPSSEQRLPVTGTIPYPPLAGGVNDKVMLGKFQVEGSSPVPPQISVPEAQFEDSLALLGVDASTPSLKSGQVFSYTLHWQALTPPAKNYTVFTHLLDAAGNLSAQQDNPPQQGYYPTSWWDPGEITLDPYTLPLPPDLPPGEYTLRIGLYEPATGQRLSLKDGKADFVDFPKLIYISKNHKASIIRQSTRLAQD